MRDYMDKSEEYLIQEYHRTQKAQAEAKAEMAKMRIEVNVAEKAAAEAEADLVKYMKENGLLSFEHGQDEFAVKDFYSVDIADPAAVPDDYMRQKLCREPDKVKIRGERPAGNGYTMRAEPKLSVKAKKS